MTKGDAFSCSFVVDLDTYRGFISIFKDRNPLHTDTKFAEGKGFAGIVMHGNILNGFLSFFVGELLPVKNVLIHSQEIQYSKPVYLNDQLTLRAEVTEVIESVHAVEFKYYFENQHKIRVAKGKIQIGILP